MSASGPGDVMASLAGELLDGLPELTDRLLARILDDAPEYGGSNVPVEELRRSCQENLAEVLEALSGDRPLDPEAPETTGRRRAEQGFPLAVVLHAFRVGGRLIWDELVERARARGDTGLGGPLAEGGRTLWEMFDTYSGIVSSAYQERTDELARVDVARQVLAVDAVLAGLASGHAPLAEGARALGLPLEGRFVVISAEPATPEAVARAVRDALHGRGGACAWRLFPDRQVGVASLGSTVTAGGIRGALAEATSRIGLSPTYGELTGTPLALRLADLARAARAGGPVGVTAYEDVPLRSVLVADPVVGWRAGESILGPLLSLPPDAGAVLLRTLAAYFAAGGSVALTAERLGCHRNTVGNRLQRVEELTGRSLRDPRSTAELVLAVEAAALFQPARLDGPTATEGG